MSWSTAGQVENEESVHQFNLLSQEQHTGMGMSMDWKASVLTPTAKKNKKKLLIILIFCFQANMPIAIGLFSSFPPPPFKFNFEKLIYNAMKFGVVNKSTILNRFVLHT